MIVSAILKDTHKTAIMQAGGVFQFDKFIGAIVQLPVDDNMTAESAFAHISRMDRDHCQCVGVVMPDGTKHVTPGHTVISDGSMWAKL